jgi:hypothetical protein
MVKFAIERVFWHQFDQKRTTGSGGNSDSLLDNFVNETTPPGLSHREQVEQIARVASKPFKILFISELLDEYRSIRGNVHFGDVGQQISKVVRNYPSLRWWMEKDGLVIDLALPDVIRLSEFDRKAGKLVCDGSENGKLSAEVVHRIATELDAIGFSLLQNLQPAQWKQIAAFNQKYSKSAIKTFTAAVSDKKFIRAIRRRLYVARDRYRAAYKVPGS